MGLLDSLLGAALGGGGQAQQQNPMAGILMQLLAGQGGGGGASAFGGGGAQGGGLGALLGGLMGGQGGQGGGGQGGGLGALLGAMTGGQGGGAAPAAGGALAAGLAALVQQFAGAGYGQQAQSWVSPGQNAPIDPQALVQVFGQDRLSQLAQSHGVPMETMLAGLAQQLPQAVDELTPGGQLPDADGVAEVFHKVAGKQGGLKS